MRKIRKFGILGVFIALLGFGSWKEDICAKGATAYFGTKEGYEWNVGKKSPMGFYLESEEGDLTEVELIITYDPEALEFKSQNEKGVTLLGEGKISLKEEGKFGDRYKRLLKFQPLISCETVVEIEEAVGKTKHQEVSFEETVEANVTIPLEAGCELKSMEIEGEGLQGFTPEKQRYQLEVENDVETLRVTATAKEGTEVEISDTGLEVGVNEIWITTINKKKKKARYELEVVRKEAVTGADSVTAGLTGNGKVTAESVEEKKEAAGQGKDSPAVGDMEGTALVAGENTELADTTDEFVIIDESVVSDERKLEINEFSWKQWALLTAVIFVGILLVVEVVLLLVRIGKQQKRRNKKLEEGKAGEGKETFEIEEIETEDVENPVVIRGNNICMDFDRAVNEYTSIKELVIQMVKGTRMKETYRALNDISFEIHKGEVIGVIGTNGAGKSTLLKIISGAMHPTSGSVEVNRSKIQILTLGTGFDMELTGRENVYLNGAIIGYEKEFIDEHYDQIVEFAELQDFMNEKVKNYSSGMVSRLGFAIATIGEAAEILILDEVLSVGDQIFQKKSMKRIKEMIHGGSTVIMVSHSTQTIRENCDRAIWIEKGQMIAMGNAKKLCAEYEMYDGDWERVMREKKLKS